MGEAGTNAKLLSVAIVCFGDFPQYSLRAIDSILRTPNLIEFCDVHVGCNACGPDTLKKVRDGIDMGLITTAIQSGRNLHKDPMVRLLRDVARTPYVLFMDDDSYVKPGWEEPLLRFIRNEDSFDVAGCMHLFHRSDRYQNLVRQRPWWHGDAYVPDEQKEWIRLCVGGAYLARTEFLRMHDFPDRGMLIDFDDVMLADLVYHVGGRMLPMPDQLLSHLVINDGDRRWKPENTPPPPAPILPRKLAPTEAMRIAVSAFKANRFGEAEAAANKVLAAEPNNSHALHLLGIIAHQTGRNTLAVELVNQAICIKSDIPDFHNNLGNIFAKLGRLDEALACFEKAIGLRPDYPEAHNNLANVLSRQGDTETAIAAYRRAVELKPNYLEPHTNLGNLLRKQGEFNQAVKSFRRAAQIDSKNADTHGSLALAYQDQGDLTNALTTIDEAISRNPDNPRLRFNRALMLLMGGDWEEGWREYEWRWRLADHHADRLRFQQPLWEGDNLAGRTLLLHCEQGLGSSIQFIRYAALALQRGGKLVLEVQAPLKKLFSSSLSNQMTVLARGEALPRFDVHLPLMSLPRVLKTTIASLPVNIPYLRAAPALVQEWRRRLSTEPGFKIGINWQGNPAYVGDPWRSIRLKHFAVLAEVPGVRFYSLQKVRGIDQITELNGALPLVQFGADMDEATGPFVDTAAIIRNLDLVITSDTSIAHLAGALGAKVWVALCFAPDWRWMLKREDCPWYPKIRLFRQTRPGDWNEVFKRIAQELAVVAARHL